LHELIATRPGLHPFKLDANLAGKKDAAQQLGILLIDSSPVAKLKFLYSLDILKLLDTSGKFRQPSQKSLLVFHLKSPQRYWKQRSFIRLKMNINHLKKINLSRHSPRKGRRRAPVDDLAALRQAT
jgi:hypothetical protein